MRRRPAYRVGDYVQVHAPEHREKLAPSIVIAHGAVGRVVDLRSNRLATNIFLVVDLLDGRRVEAHYAWWRRADAIVVLGLMV